MTVNEFLMPDAWFERSAGPRYVQLLHRLEEAIATGILPPNSSLPPERELAELTELSRVTVRKAIHELVKKGAVEQRQGSGSFVRGGLTRLEQSLSSLTSFSQDMARRGLSTHSIWLERGIFMPSPDEMLALGLAANASVARIYRLREAGGQPMALERAALPLDILPNPLDVSTSLYDLLERSGNRPVRAVQKISAINLEAHEADLLNLAEGTAGLSIQRTSYLQSGRVVELTRSIYRGDTYDFVAELRLSDMQRPGE